MPKIRRTRKELLEKLVKQGMRLRKSNKSGWLLNLQYHIVQALAESVSISEAMQKILNFICDNGRWVIGEIWLNDKVNDVLSLETIWIKPLIDASEFEEISRKITFQKGIGLPGRVWQSGEPAWVIDVVSDANFLRESAAHKIGLHGAFAFPIKGSGKVRGVMAFFSRSIEPPDDDMLKKFDAIGAQIGSFIERMRIQERVVQEKILFQTLIENLPGVFVLMDSKGNMLRWNTLYEKVTGYSADEIGRMNPLDFGSRADRDMLRQAIEEVLAKGSAIVREVALVTKSGREMPFFWTGARVLIDDKPCLIAIGIDISEKKKAEESLRESENRFRQLAEITLEGIAIHDKGIILDCNKTFTEMFGYSHSEVIGKNVLELAAPESRDIVKEKYTSGYEKFYEAVGLRKDGTTFVGVICGKAIEYKGRTARVTAIRDISEYKRMEDELNKKRNLEALGELAGGLAHDFNNLLTAILANISLSKMYLRPSDRLFNWLTNAEFACGQAKELSNRLLTFARGGLPIRKVALIQEMMKDAVHVSLKNYKIACEFIFPDNLRPVNIDKDQMRYVFGHLALNVAEAMPDRGILRVYAENVAVCEKDNPDLKEGNYVKVSFEDKGKGIPEENLPKIFYPYFSTKEMGSQKGQGLGLSICYSVIKKHEGHITVDSKVDVGTTFHIYLPAV